MVRARAVVGTVAVHCALCVLHVQADSEDLAGKSVTEDLKFVGRGLHRATMFFPLLIGISARLATLVPTFFIGLFGIFLFVAFSKKAFLISLLALLISYWDKQKHSRPKIVHIHQIGHHHPEIGALEFEPHHHNPHKFFDFPLKKPLRKWPKSDHGSWSLSGPSMDLNMDSYLPQPSRRSGSVRQPFFYTPQGVYYPRYMYMNATEPSVPLNNSVGISPELQQFIEKTLVEEEDPR